MRAYGIGVLGHYGVFSENNVIMKSLKYSLRYSLNAENSYLKLFQIAHQNLSLVMKEERSNKLVNRIYLENKEEWHSKNEKRASS